MERALQNIAAIVTIVGFLITMYSLTQSELIRPDSPSYASISVGSFFFGVVFMFGAALLFGYGFSLFLHWLHELMGGLFLVVLPPFVSFVSGFQSAAVAQISANLVGISSFVHYIWINVFVCLAVETMFVFYVYRTKSKNSSKIASAKNSYSRPKTKAEYLESSVDVVVVLNGLFFSLGAVALGFDADYLGEGTDLLALILGCAFFCVCSLFVGSALFASLLEPSIDAVFSDET